MGMPQTRYFMLEESPAAPTKQRRMQSRSVSGNHICASIHSFIHVTRLVFEITHLRSSS